MITRGRLKKNTQVPLQGSEAHPAAELLSAPSGSAHPSLTPVRTRYDDPAGVLAWSGPKSARRRKDTPDWQDDESTESDSSDSPMQKARKKSKSGKVAGAKTTRRKAVKSSTLRVGVYLKELYNAFEAQLDPGTLSGLLARGDLGDQPRNLKVNIYLGVYKFDPNSPTDKAEALDAATRAIDRMKMKLLHGKMPDVELAKLLHFDMAEYLGEEEMEKRRNLTFEQYKSHLVKSGTARLRMAKDPTSPGSPVRRGVYERKRIGGQAWEARYTKRKIKSFGSYEGVENACDAYDIGTILLFGTERVMNSDPDKFLKDGKFREGVQIPTRVKESVQEYMDSRWAENKEEHQRELARIQSYFQSPESCPIFDCSKTEPDL